MSWKLWMIFFQNVVKFLIFWVFNVKMIFVVFSLLEHFLLGIERTAWDDLFSEDLMHFLNQGWTDCSHQTEDLLAVKDFLRLKDFLWPDLVHKLSLDGGILQQTDSSHLMFTEQGRKNTLLSNLLNMSTIFFRAHSFLSF